MFENNNCLLKKTKNGKSLYIGLYVDNYLVVGDKDIIEKFMKDIVVQFQVTSTNTIKEFIGCGIKKSTDEILLHQEDLILKMKKKFWNYFKDMKVYKTPMSPGGRVIQDKIEENVKLGRDKQTKYRLGVGLLLYLLKHSRPDILNSVHELTKVIDSANKVHWKMML